MPVDPGTRFGPYEIVAQLGAGGMGEVYRARDTRLDRTVAIKVLAAALVADAESRRRFQHEARAIAALNDPHICTIHDVGHESEFDYLVLEYLEGETLADLLRRSRRLPIDEALAIAIQIGDALDRAHRADVLAFGGVLYEMLAGRKAFEGAPPVTVIPAIMSPEPPPIADLQSAHPLLDRVLRRCLDKDRERRWQSIRDVTSELSWIA